VEFDYYKTFSHLISTYSQGVQEGEEYCELVGKYGKCNIEIPDRGVLLLLIESILTPFYIFQIFSVILWMCTHYEVYAACIFLTSAISITVELIDIRTNLKKLKEMMHYECRILVQRLDSMNERVFRDISSCDLVPGDIIVVPEGCHMPCDAIQMTGSSIINEAMLTGESIPVIKNPLPNIDNKNYNPDEDKGFTLFSGTEVIQTRKLGCEKVTALVTRTGYDTLKGSLIKAILYPKPNRFSFHSDSMKFIGVLGIISIIGFLLTLHTSLKYLSKREIIIKALDLVTVTVPPALPAAMSIGVVYALSRLKKSQIYCIAPERINVAGRIKTIVFDKTGTLTEDSLKFSGVTIAKKETFSEFEEDFTRFQESISTEEEKDLHDTKQKFTECMVTWHSIAHVHDRFIGDPLDIEMFKATKWTMNEDVAQKNKELIELSRFYSPNILNKEGKNQDKFIVNSHFILFLHNFHIINFIQVDIIQEWIVYLQRKIENHYEVCLYKLIFYLDGEIELTNQPKSRESKWLGVFKRFDFSSALQRMSVITLNHSSNKFTAFVKGSPEMIQSLTIKDTLPENFFEALEKYTQDGLRVLALAYKPLDEVTSDWIIEWKREEIECDLYFLGFLIMENKVKPQTNPCIEKLQNANIGTIMATGDNGLTGVAVGRKCGIINPYKTVYFAEKAKVSSTENKLKWIKIECPMAVDDYIRKDSQGFEKPSNLQT
jgi:cation-transporting P-type ATPase 13A2